jgi:mannose-6-phosphate isomerase-like protein (cupin superfamily)
MTKNPDRAVLLDPDAGRHLWTMGMLMTVKASADETGDACFGYGGDLPLNVGPPMHIHRREAELNYVLRGAMKFRCGDDELDCEAGGFVFLPKEMPHAFKSGPDGATMLAIALPGGIEGLREGRRGRIGAGSSYGPAQHCWVARTRSFLLGLKSQGRLWPNYCWAFSTHPGLPQNEAS